MPEWLEADSRGRSALLAHMRHELRTPLNAIIGYSEMLLEDAGQLARPDLIPGLEQVRGSGHALLGIVNDLLDSSRVHAKNGDLHPSFAERMRAEIGAPLCELISYTTGLREETEQHDPDGLLPEIRKIHEAAERLRGLLENVADLTGEGSASALEEAGEKSGLSTLIRDVFDTVRPLDPSLPHDAPQRGRILVVDDNQSNRELLASRLEREGHQATLAENGVRALEMIREDPPDLVLLDMMMPELNGYQVLQHLKQDERLRHVPVIMLSALDEMDSVVRCIEAGAEDYLAKPFNPVLLRARINACLEKKRFRDREVRYVQEIQEEKRRSDELLHVILPAEIVAELKETNAVRPRLYDNVAVLFCDVVGFTPYCESQSPEEVISSLQRLVEVYEELTLEHDLQKIKTVGDSFMATAGLLNPVENPVLSSVKCGLRMLETREHSLGNWKVRIGIHVGPVIAGVVGHRQYLFDLWGDTVNTAARVESHGREGRVNVSETAWHSVREHCEGSSLGLVQVKGKGQMELYEVSRLKTG